MINPHKIYDQISQVSLRDRENLSNGISHHNINVWYSSNSPPLSNKPSMEKALWWPLSKTLPRMHQRKNSPSLLRSLILLYGWARSSRRSTPGLSHHIIVMQRLPVARDDVRRDLQSDATFALHRRSTLEVVGNPSSFMPIVFVFNLFSLMPYLAFSTVVVISFWITTSHGKQRKVHLVLIANEICLGIGG